MNPFAWQLNGYNVTAYARTGVEDNYGPDSGVILGEHPNGARWVTATIVPSSLKAGDWCLERFFTRAADAEADFIKRANLNDSIPF